MTKEELFEIYTNFDRALREQQEAQAAEEGAQHFMPKERFSAALRHAIARIDVEQTKQVWGQALYDYAANELQERKNEES